MMDLQTRKLHLVEEILASNNENVIEKLESVFLMENQELTVLKEKLTARALKANEDIEAGRVFDRKEAEARVKLRIGI